MSLDTYYTLGRSGLRVSPLALGTMTFGQPAWGAADLRTSGLILDAYLDAGGNFVDTADVYSGGESEQLVGKLLAERGVRDRTVLSTKFTLGGRPGDPNAGGNGRKSMMRSVEGSLQRLGTDYIDLYIVHAWDGLTPVEEVMRGLDDLVSSGKVRYVALSDVPAWYAARAQTLAEWRDYAPLVALQLEYSLTQRGLEYEFPALAQELGMGLMTWGPLSGGLLSGKYSADATAEPTEGRLTVAAEVAPRMDTRNDRNWRILAGVTEVAKEIGRTPAQVAVNWVANRPAVGSVLLGASRPQQIQSTVNSLDFAIPDDLRARLDEVSAPPKAVPYSFMDALQSGLNGEVRIKGPGYHARTH